MKDPTNCRIHGDRWEGVSNLEWHVDPASLADLDRALDRLDAETYTMLTVQCKGQQHLTVGGGSGRYVVYATFDNEEFWNLLCPHAKGGMILLNAGGQEGDYPAKQVVDIAQARAAARSFLQEHKLDPNQQWEKQ